VSQPALPRPARIAGLIFAWALGVLLVAGIVAAGWIGVRGAAAFSHLRAAESAVREAVDNLSDPTRAADLIARVSAEASEARALTSDPVWQTAEHLPWIGPQLHAVSTVAAAADDVAGTALTPLAEVAASFSLDAFRPTDGRIDTAVFEQIAAPAQTGAAGVAAAAASVDGLDGDALLGPVRSAVDEVSDLLRTSTTATDALARAAQLLPAMLGTGGERDYLVVFQNNAEWRSLGGIVGAMVLVHTADGSLQLTSQASAQDFGKYEMSVLPLDPEVERLYGNRPGQWMQNVTQVPDFTVTGALARQMWLQEKGQEVDGVISLDPVALSYLLEATGPITLPTGDVLSAENTVPLLLNEVYLRYENPRDQDAFFASAAAAVFDALSTGSADPAALVAALSRAGDERRLLLWSALPEDQDVLADTTLAGTLPVSDDETARFGVYLNDGTGSKMDYYVTADTTVGWGACALDAAGHATGDVTLTVQLANTAPADAAAALPRYITGGGVFGTPVGTASTVGYLYLPEGYELLSASLSNDQGFGGGNHQGRQVLSFGVDLAPGETVGATLTARPTAPGAAAVEAETTPTARADQPTTIGARCP